MKAPCHYPTIRPPDYPPTGLSAYHPSQPLPCRLRRAQPDGGEVRVLRAGEGGGEVATVAAVRLQHIEQKRVAAEEVVPEGLAVAIPEFFAPRGAQEAPTDEPPEIDPERV